MKKRYIALSLSALLVLAGCNKEEVKPMPIPPLEEVSEEVADTPAEEVVEPEVKEEKPVEKEAKAEVKPAEDTIDEDAFLKAVERVKALDYKKMAEGGLARSKKLAPTDRDLRKWIIRIHMYHEIRGEKVEDKTLLTDAKSALARRTAWFKYVEKEYKVKSSKSEIDAYIKKEAKNSAETKEIAKALGMTADYMNTEYERDQYHQQLLWTKLIPELKKKFPKKEGESDDAHITRINTEFNKELDAFVKK